MPEQESDRIFNSAPKNMTYDIKYAAFKFLTANPDYFEQNLKGKLMKIQFTNISDFGKPQQPKVLGFKDQKLQAKFLKDIS